MIKESGIYTIINHSNGKLYIGSTNNLYNRYHNHFSTLKRNLHFNKFMQNSFNKHGLENFEFIVIEKCKEEDLIEREQHYLDVIMPDYNIRKLAERNTGIIFSEERRRKISQSNMGRVTSEETRKKISLANTGKIRSPEENLKRSISLSTLNKEQVREVLILLKEGKTSRQIAEIFPLLKRSSIDNIRTRKTYRWVDRNV